MGQVFLWCAHSTMAARSFALISLMALTGLALGHQCTYDSYNVVCSDLVTDSGDYVRQFVDENVPTDTSTNVNLVIVNSELTFLPSDVFEGPNWGHFVCSKCSMQAFPFSAMESLGRFVTEVFVFSSQITAITSNNDVGLPFKDTVHTIVFSSNYIGRIESYSFAAFTALSNLALNASKNQPILQDYAFANIPNVQEIYLTSMRLTEIQPNTFRALPELRALDLSVNEIKTLPSDIFNDDDTPNLEYLTLTANPWNCSCDLLWLRDYIDDAYVDLLGVTTWCESPVPEIFMYAGFDCPHSTTEYWTETTRTTTEYTTTEQISTEYWMDKNK